MSEPSRRRLIVEGFLDRLQEITEANGYRTDAGETLVVGQIPQLSPDKGDATIAIAVLIGEDDVQGQGNKMFLTLPIDIFALRVGNTPSAWLDVEDGLADIKQAVEADPYLDGLLSAGTFSRGQTATYDREAGSLQIGARVRYLVPYTEQWGSPEA